MGANGGWKDAVRFERPEVIDRQLDREKFARWKVVCSCGKIWYLENMSITQVAEQTTWTHEAHSKEVYFRDGGKLDHRGGLPPTIQEVPQE